MGQPVLLELLTAQSRTTLRPFHGHVLAFELLGAAGGYVRYCLQIGSWLDFLRHRTDSWLLQGKTVVVITEAVFADYAAQDRLQPKWRWDLKQAIADHNGAFAANAQSRIRLTQPCAVMKEDSLTQWHGRRREGTTA
jgi:type VI secretion system secreted protein VgrG